MVGRVRCLLCLCVLLPLRAVSQEVLLPVQTAPAVRAAKQSTPEALTLPFFDDFAAPAAVPSQQRWQSAGATLSDGHGLLPPTVGVATLDAIDATGHLYEKASISAFPADTLCSRPVRLDSLTPADSVVLSFYYLPGGGRGNLWERVGDTPDADDSLFLDFYRAADSCWVTVWSRGGVSVDSLVATTGRDWQYVTLGLTDSVWFDSLFAFRFRNFCSLPTVTKPGLAGNCDYWHLDYVYLDRGRSLSPTPVFRDIAFVTAAPTLLADYRAMPARQYRMADMSDSLSVTITNLYNSELATRYSYAVLDGRGDTLHSYDGGYRNAPVFLPDGTYQSSPSHARPPVAFAFPEGDTAVAYTVVHVVREGVVGDSHGDNDTVRFRQVFDNYYAYDDGTAENGYGLTSTSSRVYLAYRFDLNVEDTLTAVDLYFNRTAEGENEQVPFRLMVWANDNGQPGTVLYSDQHNRHPEFDGLNDFRRYVTESPVVVDGSIFVGFEQSNNHYINLGFDRSFNTADRIYYLTGNRWQQSILSGSLMMRPCFGAAATVGIAPQPHSPFTFHLYPNPASDYVTAEGFPEGAQIELYDVMGKKILAARTSRFSVSEVPSGVYIVRCVTRQGEVGIRKLIIRH